MAKTSSETPDISNTNTSDDWLNKVTYVDKWGRSAVGKSPGQKQVKGNGEESKFKKLLHKKSIRVISYIQLSVILVVFLAPIVEFIIARFPGGSDFASFPITRMLIIQTVIYVLVISTLVELIIIICTILKKNNEIDGEKDKHEANDKKGLTLKGFMITSGIAVAVSLIGAVVFYLVANVVMADGCHPSSCAPEELGSRKIQICTTDCAKVTLWESIK